MKNKNGILTVLIGVLAMAGLFAWLYLGSEVPEITPEDRKFVDNSAHAAVYNTVLTREKDGKLLWELKVGKGVEISKKCVSIENVDGMVHLKNGDILYVKADGGEMKILEDEFSLKGNVYAYLEKGGQIKAEKILWQQDANKLSAEGAVKIKKEDLLAEADKVITSGELKHFILKGNAHVERGGKDEN